MSQQLTSHGYSKFKKELANKLKLRKKLAKKLNEALATGDWFHDNQLVQDAQYKFDTNERRIIELNYLLRTAEIKDKNNSNSEKISIGSKVTLQKEDGTSIEITLVPAMEADPMNKRISIESDLGKALLEKTKGDEINLHTPAGKRKYLITSYSQL